MECKDIRGKLSPYLEGDLLPEEKKAVLEHLPSCPYCRAALEDLKKTEELVRSLEEVEPPAWMTQKIMSRVREEEERKGRLWRKLFYPLHIKVPVEAMATLFIAVIAVYVFRAVEPEMKRAQLPVSPGQVVTEEKAPTPSPEPKAPSQALQDKFVQKEQAQKEGSVAPPAPPSVAVEPPGKEGTPPLEVPAPGKKKEALAERTEEGMRSADALRKLELGESRLAPPPAPQARESSPT
jgi:anti-sigma factor RsiW